MKIKSLKSSSIEEISKIDFDILLGSSGYEKRSSYLYDNFELNGSTKICLGFKSNKRLSRKENDKIYENLKFKLIEVNDNSIDELSLIFNDIFRSIAKSSLRVLVDYSSMSTYMYFSILKYLSDCNLFEEAVVYFSYTPASYIKPKVLNTLKHNNPIQKVTNIDFTDNKIALIVGLGYEKDKALGMYEYFQNHYDDMYLFYTNNKEYVSDIITNNQELISIIEKNNIIKYEIANTSYLVVTLNSLIDYLSSHEYRVVIAPTGPKVFTLISLIISFFNSKVSVYRSSEGNSENIQDKFADKNKRIIANKVVFINDLELENN